VSALPWALLALWALPADLAVAPPAAVTVEGTVEGTVVGTVDVASALPWPAIDDDVARTITAAVDDVLSTERLTSIAGLSMGVLHRGHVWRQNRGVIQPTFSMPATSQTSWRLASITKTMTAIAVMQLVDEGRLGLDDAVATLLPQVPKAWRAITVRQLLGHTSGIRHYPRRGPERRLTKHLTTSQTLALFARRPLAHPPGERFLYTTYGYDVLGAIIERVTGRPYAEALGEQLFEPLGLQSTVVEDSRARQASWPDGLRITKRGVVVKSDRVDVSSRFAGGGVRSTIDDLLQYADALLTHSLVDDDVFRQMASPSVTGDGRVNDYGLGFAVYPQRGHLVVAHAGGQPETTSLLYLIPAEDLAIVLATNLEGQGDALSAVAQAITEVTVEDGVPRRSVWTNDTDGVDAVIVDGLNRAFTHGRAFVDRIAVDDAATDAAFARFAALLDARGIKQVRDASRARLREAHHPINGRVTPTVGAAIARALRDVDGDAFATLPRRGPLAFFADWVALCERDTVRCPPQRNFSPELSATVRRLHQAWLQTPAAVHHLRRHGLTQVPETVAALSPLLGLPVHPDFSGDLLETSHHLLASRPADAVTIARLNIALHPRMAVLQLALAEALLVRDDDDSAMVALEEAWGLGGPAGLPPALWLGRIQHLRQVPAPRADAAATSMLSFARGVFPADASLAAAKDDDDDDDGT
jgi:CubicO group peptidase (beta-lactamase class C family)